MTVSDCSCVIAAANIGRRLLGTGTGDTSAGSHRSLLALFALTKPDRRIIYVFMDCGNMGSILLRN